MMLPLQVRVDMEAMAIKKYSAFPKSAALLEPHVQIVLCHIVWGGGLTPTQRSNRCILQFQPTGQCLALNTAREPTLLDQLDLA